MWCHWVLSGRKPSTINPACMRGTSLFDSLQWGAEPLSPHQKGLGCSMSPLSLLVGCTPGWGPLLGLRQFQCRVLLSTFWLKLETFLNLWSRLLTWSDPCLMSHQVSGWDSALWRIGWRAPCGIFTPNISQQITFSHIPHLPSPTQSVRFKPL